MTALACGVFLAYAGCFLYFFVDDEAIPLVYARNLLRGRGFTYTSLEGRAEGFSDFLHVLWSAFLLAVTHAFNLSLLMPLLAGKAISLAAGAGVIVMTAVILKRDRVSSPGLVAGLGFLALAGPLAVWSCSSLETVTFALLVSGLACALLFGGWRSIAAMGAAVILMRIDGTIYATALVLAVYIGVPAQRPEVKRAAAWLAAVALGFHAWRFWYFGHLLSSPMAAKVLFHLIGPAHAMRKAPDQSYLAGFLGVYGWAAAPALLAAAIVARRDAAARMAALSLLMLGPYVQIVGDWMFGWRFVVALLPFVAVLIGLAVSRLPRRAAWATASVVMAWSAVSVTAFVPRYVASEHKPIFWRAPRAGEAAWLGRYEGLVEAGRGFLHRGDRVAYNQAGLIPYLFDLENIDDLGICSDFVARLPTTDVYYTEVGRYSPLTNQPVLRTAHAYLLYQNVKYILAPTDLVRKANNDTIPPAILAGLYRLVRVDATGNNAIYKRSHTPAPQYRSDPAVFTENVAHTSRLLRAALGGQEIPLPQLGPMLPFLREMSGSRTFTGDFQINATFASADEDISAFYVGDFASAVPCIVTITLFGTGGGATLTRTLTLAAGHSVVYERFPAGTWAAAMSIAIDVPGDADRVTLSDVRLEGQSAALRNYIRSRLRFPPS